MFCVSEDIYIGHIPQEVSNPLSDTSSLPSIATSNIFTTEKNETPGCQPGVIDQSVATDIKGLVVPPIISRDPIWSSSNNSLSTGSRMQNGYIQSQRALRTDQRFTSLTFKEKHLLIELQNLVVWKETPFWIGRKKIILKKGQYCTTERDFTNHLNSTLAKSDPKYTKTTTRRIIKKLFEMQISYQDVDQGRTILTIIDPTFYPFENEKSGPECGPKVDQEWTTKEEVQELKEDKNPPLTPPSSGTGSGGVSISNQTKKPEMIAHGSHVKLTEQEFIKLKSDHPKFDIPALIDEMNDFCSASKPKGYANYSAAIRNWIRRRESDGQKANIPPEKEEFYEVIEHLKSLGYSSKEGFGKVVVQSSLGYEVGSFKVGDISALQAMIKEKGIKTK